MKRVLSLIFLLSLFFVCEPVFCMKRENSFANLYDEYKRADGKYHCHRLGCGQRCSTTYAFQQHLMGHEVNIFKTDKKKRKKDERGLPLKKRKSVLSSGSEMSSSESSGDEESVLGKRKRTSQKEASWHPKKKKRKKEKPARKYKKYSHYDQFLQNDGLYHCPDCKYTGYRKKNFQNHSHRMGHAGHKRTGRLSKYEKKDGKLYCPDCNFSIEDISQFGTHLRKHGHGSEEAREIIRNGRNVKKGRKYEKYKGDNDNKYYCPDCSFSSANYKKFYQHLRFKEHGGVQI